MRHYSPDVAANQTADGHRRAVLPVHTAIKHEHKHSDSSHPAIQEILQRNHMANLARRNEGQSADHQDTDARSKDRKSTRLNSSHDQISYAVFCLKKK